MDGDGLKLLVLGSGDAFGSGGRNFPAYALLNGARSILLDCGPSALPALKAAGMDSSGLGTILASHLHGDHVGGLPFFFLEYQFLSLRNDPLCIVGPPGVRARCEELLRATYPDLLERQTWRFSVRYREMPPRSSLTMGDLSVESFPMAHGSLPHALGFRIHWGGATIGYTGDTQWNPSVAELARGCDLLLCECFFFNGDHHAHIRYVDLMAHRGEIGAKRILLIHPGPEMLERIDRLELEVAQDGMVLELTP